MAQIDDALSSLSDDEARLLASDPELLAAFKAKYAPSTGQMVAGAAKNAILAPIQAGKVLLTNPTKVAAETPILPVGGAIAAGPAGGAAGEGLRQMAQIAQGAPAPTPLQSALQMTGAAIVPSVGKGAEAAAGIGGRLLTPSIQESNAALMPILEKHGLKDVMPVVFNKGERDAAIAYAQNAAKNAENLTPQMLQEARSTLKDVLDNRIVQPNSPTGQIVSRAKDAVTTALSKALPDVGEGLSDLGESYAAEPTKRAGRALLQQAKRAAILATVGGAVGTPIAYGVRKLLP